MNRTIFTVAGMLSASSFMLLDSAVKGAALLALAALAVLMLRRDSAATRHLVWLLGMVALLAAPLLSALLPQWRVLPGWARNRHSSHRPTGSGNSIRIESIGLFPACRPEQFPFLNR